MKVIVKVLVLEGVLVGVEGIVVAVGAISGATGVTICLVQEIETPRAIIKRARME